MITTTEPAGTGSASTTPADVSFGVRTGVLHQECESLRRAVEQSRRLLDHPGLVRGRAQDCGDDDLRDAAALLASRWQYGLQALVAEAEALLTRLRAATQLYDDVERTSTLGPLPSRPAR
ncbi:MAG TPA: hypothetical protein VFL94_08350 [Actinomycetales bacterium]|nr:hypothetical protein [Actinomycetales bacterium]